MSSIEERIKQLEDDNRETHLRLKKLENLLVGYQNNAMRNAIDNALLHSFARSTNQKLTESRTNFDNISQRFLEDVRRDTGYSEWQFSKRQPSLQRERNSLQRMTIQRQSSRVQFGPRQLSQRQPLLRQSIR